MKEQLFCSCGWASLPASGMDARRRCLHVLYASRPRPTDCFHWFLMSRRWSLIHDGFYGPAEKWAWLVLLLACDLNTFYIVTAPIYYTVINPSIHSFMAYIKVTAIIYHYITSFVDWFSTLLQCSYRWSISSGYLNFRQCRLCYLIVIV